MSNKIQDALNKCFNPVNYSLGRDDNYLVSHVEYEQLKKELNDALVSTSEVKDE